MGVLVAPTEAGYVDVTVSLLESKKLSRLSAFPPSCSLVLVLAFVTVASERGVADKSGYQNDERAE